MKAAASPRWLACPEDNCIYNLTIYNLQTMLQRIKYTLAAALLCLPLCSWAEGEDSYGTWFELGVSKSLNKKFSVDLGAELRTQEKARAAVSLGATYKPFKFLKFSAGYSFIDKYKSSKWEDHYKKDIVDPDNWNGRDFRPSYWRITHRAYADITGSVKFWKVLRISVRERYQFSHNSCKEIDETEWRYTKESYYDPEKGPYYVYELKDGYPLVDPKIKEATDDHVLRSRLKIEFDKKGLFVTPFLSAEAHNSLSNSLTIEKVRASAGAKFKVCKWFDVTAAYVFTNEFRDDMTLKLDSQTKRIHAFNLGLNFDF